MQRVDRKKPIEMTRYSSMRVLNEEEVAIRDERRNRLRGLVLRFLQFFIIVESLEFKVGDVQDNDEQPVFLHNLKFADELPVRLDKVSSLFSNFVRRFCAFIDVFEDGQIPILTEWLHIVKEMKDLKAFLKWCTGKVEESQQCESAYNHLEEIATTFDMVYVEIKLECVEADVIYENHVKPLLNNNQGAVSITNRGYRFFFLPIQFIESKVFNSPIE